MDVIIGRELEIKLLQETLHSKEAELIAIYGRRRVGKTFLIRNVFKEKLIFEFVGLQNASTHQQLENFSLTLSGAAKSAFPIAVPTNWINAFEILKSYVGNQIKTKKYVIFFDEFPWISTHKSGFFGAFQHFWNSWASRQENLIVVICGSAASWMIQKVVNNKGGLHNRITRKIRLLPFTLNETEAYFRNKRIILDHYQLLQLYMVVGGVPHYLRDIKPGESATQNIDRLCFTKDGLLHNEFRNLYSSLFDNAERHITVVRALAAKNAGLTRNEIIEVCKLTSGGSTTKLLDELAESGFITEYIPFDKNVKQSIYKLSDEYSRFYLKFIEGNRASGPGTWIKLSRSASWRSWSGVAFENICLKHIPQIKKALGIAGVYTEESAWRYISQKDENGTQIDLLIDRQDFCINICEIKFSDSDFSIDKKYAADLQNKLNIFKDRTKTRKSLFLTMVTTFGVKENDYKLSIVQNDIKMNALFERLQ